MGLVFRNERDGKQYRQKYCLTEKGRGVVEDIVRTSAQIRDRICRGVARQDEDAFYRVLEIMCRNSQELPADVEI